MSSYSSLRSLATVFTVVGWLNIIVPVGMILFLILGNAYVPDNPFSSLLLPQALLLMMCMLPSIIWFAMAQFIKLFIDIATRMETIDNNLYVIATKAEQS